MTATYNSVITAILSVFAAISEWIVTSVQAMIPIFFADGALTFLGTLSIAGLSFSIVFLLLGLIQKFMHFAG